MMQSYMALIELLHANGSISSLCGFESSATGACLLALGFYRTMRQH